MFLNYLNKNDDNDCVMFCGLLTLGDKRYWGLNVLLFSCDASGDLLDVAA